MNCNFLNITLLAILSLNLFAGETTPLGGFKVTKGHVDSADRKTEFEEIEEQSTSITLEETDAGQVITVFVIVAGGNA